MQRIALLFLVVLGSVTLMHAQSSTDTKKLNGTVCDSSCVVQVEGANTCDRGCQVKSGEAVLVDDQGSVMFIANQDICQSKMGKHVTATVRPTTQPAQPAAAAGPTERQREHELREREQYFQVLQMETLEPL